MCRASPMTAYPRLFLMQAHYFSVFHGPRCSPTFGLACSNEAGLMCCLLRAHALHNQRGVSRASAGCKVAYPLSQAQPCNANCVMAPLQRCHLTTQRHKCKDTTISVVQCDGSERPNLLLATVSSGNRNPAKIQATTRFLWFCKIPAKAVHCN